VLRGRAGDFVGAARVVLGRRLAAAGLAAGLFFKLVFFATVPFFVFVFLAEAPLRVALLLATFFLGAFLPAVEAFFFVVAFFFAATFFLVAAFFFTATFFLVAAFFFAEPALRETFFLAAFFLATFFLLTFLPADFLATVFLRDAFRTAFFAVRVFFLLLLTAFFVAILPASRQICGNGRLYIRLASAEAFGPPNCENFYGRDVIGAGVHSGLRRSVTTVV